MGLYILEFVDFLGAEDVAVLRVCQCPLCEEKNEKIVVWIDLFEAIGGAAVCRPFYLTVGCGTATGCQTFDQAAAPVAAATAAGSFCMF